MVIVSEMLNLLEFFLMFKIFYVVYSYLHLKGTKKFCQVKKSMPIFATIFVFRI